MRSGRRVGFYWTREAIVYAMDLWHREHLRAPTLREWSYASENHPTYVTVMRRFGSWNKAIRAAGFRPLAPGHKRTVGDRPRCPHTGRFVARRIEEAS